MRVLLTFSYGVSLESWEQYGYLTRETSIYKKIAEDNNVNFKFLTYGTENDLRYNDIIGNTEVIPVGNLLKSKIPKYHFIKSLFLPQKFKDLFKNIDLIKSYQAYGSWIACIAKILFKKKVIVRCGFGWLNYHILSYKKKGLKQYIKYLAKYVFIFLNELVAYKLADGIISTNNQDVLFIRKCYRLNRKYKSGKIKQFFNSIDENIFKQLNLEKKDKSVLFVGRLSYDKNLFNLIKAFKGLDGFKLNIIGRGPEEFKLRQLAKSLNVTVNLLGIIPNANIPEYINQNQMFILPSYSEGNPLALLEAMSCEAACIGSNVKGINNVLKHGINGYLCETNSESIKNAIIDLYNNNKLREEIGKNARKFVLENCKLDSIADKEYCFYKDILKMRSANK